MGIWREIGGTFKTKSKKAFTVSERERKSISRIKTKWGGIKPKERVVVKGFKNIAIKKKDGKGYDVKRVPIIKKVKTKGSPGLIQQSKKRFGEIDFRRAF